MVIYIYIRVINHLLYGKIVSHGFQWLAHGSAHLGNSGRTPSAESFLRPKKTVGPKENGV